MIDVQAGAQLGRITINKIIGIKHFYNLHTNMVNIQDPILLMELRTNQ